MESCAWGWGKFFSGGFCGGKLWLGGCRSGILQLGLGLIFFQVLGVVESCGSISY